MKTSKLLAVLLAALFASIFSARARGDSFGSGANVFDLAFVTIGNPGNAADTRSPNASPNPAGSVPYTYNMGTYEVSRDMITKANASGNLGIPLVDMTPYGGNGVNRPACLSWNEAARFVNWLNTSTGSAPAYKFALQPGDVGYSSDAFNQLWTTNDPGYDQNNPFRNTLARYFLPNIDDVV